ncbi:disulfide bond formation protein DsbA [Candidatus Peregrinibacteria bacterium CG_4_10_14_0_2_um_filter_43_11]|nr:MAG: disulfide bond formation protein DsbA [Candidatus Peregrinibacteria bacterium CG_4_10_14_0_2_um_filter_43_11]
MTSSTNNGLRGAIIFASIMVTIALLFNGFAYLQGNSSLEISESDDLQEQIKAGIETYIQKQQGNAGAPQAEANEPTIVEGDFTDDDAVLGDENAPVTLIEWSDYECPFCKRHFTQTFPQIKEKYIDSGKVKMIFRDFPLSFHDPLATQEAIAAECAREQGGDETYFAYHDLIFKTTTSNGSGMQKDQFYELADKVGINKAKFTECLDSEKYKDEVQKDIADGGKAGVSGTPAFLINGQFISGAQPFSVFEQVIEAELNK